MSNKQDNDWHTICKTTASHHWQWKSKILKYHCTICVNQKANHWKKPIIDKRSAQLTGPESTHTAHQVSSLGDMSYCRQSWFSQHWRVPLSLCCCTTVCSPVMTTSRNYIKCQCFQMQKLIKSYNSQVIFRHWQSWHVGFKGTHSLGNQYFTKVTFTYIVCR